ncbi:MAG: formylglycine-generating enzyme family protein, partial [Acidobacteriota bacterium]
RIVIQPLDPIRIRHFIDDYLGAERGESLFWGLVGFDHTNRLFCDYCGGKCDCFYTYPTIDIGSVQKYHRDFISQLGVRPEDAEQFFWLKQEAPEDNERVRMDVSNGWSRWITLRDNPASLLALSRNPFLLKTICPIYETANTIPENTARFIDLLVRALIQREINSKRVLPDEIEPFLDVLSQLAYGIKTSSERQASMMVDDGQGLTTERLLELASSASLLDVNDRIRFAHPLLQEYFTAIGLEKEIRRGVFNATEIWPPESWWQRTKWDMATLLLAGLQTDDCSEVVDWVAAANPEVAAECIVLSGAALALPTTERLHREWQARLGDPARDPDPYARAAVGRALGLTRWDNRDGIGTKKVEIDGQTIVLPDFERAWIEIPAGQFIYGPSIEHDLRKGGYIESPPWEVTLPSFRISRYPVTFAQFQTFIDDPDGYQDQERWFGGLTRNEQDRRVQDQFFRVGGKPSYNEPRETVNWYQAVAFCRWLSWRLGGSYDLKEINQWIVRLPTEVEWERAARGLDGRIYPYGNEFNSAKGNTWETRLACTTAVGIFPEGASPDGLLDMCGNVREWCLGCDFKSNGDRATIARMKKVRQPQRGGSFDDLKDWSRVFYRSDCIACESDCEVGCRVVSVVGPLS